MNKILKKEIGPYEGYILRTVHTLTNKPMDWETMKIFSRIPKKISTFVKKEMIKSLRRYKINNLFSRNQYFIQTINNEFFELIY